MAALGSIRHRFAGSEGERQMLHAVKGRLPEHARGRIEGFVGWTSPAPVTGLHALALLAAGVLGLFHPLIGALLCAGFTLSLWAEETGRFSAFRRIAPKRASYNLIVPQTGSRGLGAVVLSAPLDSPSWRPASPRWLRRPLKAVLIAAFVVTGLLFLSALAEPWGRPTRSMYWTSLLVFAGTVALTFLMQRRRAGTEEDASGPAVLLELMRRFHDDPPANVDIWFVFTGCGHAYQNGMGAFLGMHGKTMPDPVFVLALDDPGRAPVSGVVSEGALIAQHHRPTGPALLERLQWAGVDVPTLDLPGSTDARPALLAGYRALALSGEDGSESDPATADRSADVSERLVRWFDDDLARVADDASFLGAAARGAAEEVAS